MQIIAIHSSGGNTGKSTIVANLAARLVLRGQRVLVIDANFLSPTIHAQFGLRPHDSSLWLNDALVGNAAIEDTLHYMGDLAAHGGPGLNKLSGLPLWIVPANPDREAVRSIIAQGYDFNQLMESLKLLRQTVQADYLLIDTEPGMQEIAMLLMAIADSVLLTVRPGNDEFLKCAVLIKVARSLEVTNVKLVVNHVDTVKYQVNAIEHQVREALKVPVVRVLPLAAGVMELHTSDIFALLYPDHHWSVALDAIAAAVLT